MRTSVALWCCLACGPMVAVAGADPTTQGAPAPATPTAKSSPVASVGAPAATTTAPDSNALPAPSDKAQVLAAADEKLLLSRGYRRETHEGQTLYCRKETVVGSHFEKKVCGTPEQIAASVRVSKDVTQQSQRQNNPLPLNAAELELGHK